MCPADKIEIRKANVNDTRDIAQIHVASWQKVYRGIIPDSVLDFLSIQDREQNWTRLIKQGVIVLLIEKNKSVVGFASVCLARDGDLDTQQYGEISAIYLHPDFWRHGLGKQLCNAALKKLETDGFPQAIVWVINENTLAQKFYESMGFMWTGYFKEERFEDAVTLCEVRLHRKFSQKFAFKRLQENDLDLLYRWFCKPHVKEWWNDYLTDGAIRAKYSARIGDEVVVPFIAYIENKPIGFIQYYQADKVGGDWWPDITAGTIGIDQFIGEENYINKGYGTLMISEFVDHLFSNPLVKKIITDVDPSNMRAIRCYEKVGFDFVKSVMTPDGFAHLMQIAKKTKICL